MAEFGGKTAGISAAGIVSAAVFIISFN